MKIKLFDLPLENLCDRHLSQQHDFIHIFWLTLFKGQKVYRKNPELLRWKNKTGSLWFLHHIIVDEMMKRNLIHKTDLDFELTDKKMTEQTEFTDTIEEQLIILNKLKQKYKCTCKCKLKKLKNINN